jgi:hypothetical protein
VRGKYHEAKHDFPDPGNHGDVLNFRQLETNAVWSGYVRCTGGILYMVLILHHIKHRSLRLGGCVHRRQKIMQTWCLIQQPFYQAQVASLRWLRTQIVKDNIDLVPNAATLLLSTGRFA